MSIKSAKFIKGVTGDDEVLADGRQQIAFIGRSNVGKSSLINSLTHQKDLAKTSSFPGRTQQINIFLVNNKVYFIDLPGYGFAKASKQGRERLEQLINWYFFDSENEQKKVVLIIDAEIGPTKSDLEMLHDLEVRGKNVVIVANKIDKIKKSVYKKQLQKIRESIENRAFIPYSSFENIGVSELAEAILN